MAAPGSGKIGRSLKEVKRPGKERIQIPVEWEIARERKRKSADVGEREPGRDKSWHKSGINVIIAAQVDAGERGLELQSPWRGTRAGAAIRAREGIQPVDLSVMVQIVGAGVEPGERAERERAPEKVAIRVHISPINQGAVRFGPIQPCDSQRGVLRQPPADVGRNVEENLLESGHPQPQPRKSAAGRGSYGRRSKSELSQRVADREDASVGHRPEREGAEEKPSPRINARRRQKSGSRDQRDAVLAAAHSDALAIDEEVELVIDDGAPDRATEIVADQVAFADTESVGLEAGGVEGVAAIELEDVTSPDVAPGAGRDVNQTAAEPPEFGAEPVGDDVDLLHAFERHALSERRPEIDDVLTAVYLNVVERRRLAVDRKVLVRLRVEDREGDEAGNRGAAQRIDPERRDVA